MSNAYEAAKTALEGIWYASDYLSDETERVDFEGLENPGISPSDGEALVVSAALSLWNGSEKVSLYEIISRLDAVNFDNLIRAMWKARGRS